MWKKLIRVGWGWQKLVTNKKSNALSALCHILTTYVFLVTGNSVAMLFLLCLGILHFDWLVNWLDPMALEGALGGGGVYTLGALHTLQKG